MAKREKTSQKTKAGNQGDVPKHVSLMLLAGKLLQIHNHLSEPFIYLETHAGYPSYPLSKGGSWEEGVERLDKALGHAVKGLVGGHPMSKPLLSPYAPFDEYLETSGFRVTEKSTYYGSSTLVENAAHAHLKNIHMILHDTNKGTCMSLKTFFPSHQIELGDGYEGANVYCRQIQPTPNLVLIDPFALGENQEDDIRPLVTLLADKGIPFLCWTPRLGPIGKHSKVSKKYPEEPKYVAFQEWAKGRGLKPILLSWKKPNPHMWGCCLLTNEVFEPMIRSNMQNLCVVMSHVKGTQWVLWP